MLQESDISDELGHPTEAAIATVGVGATTAAMAGAVPKESEKSVGAPGAFPETPAAEPSSFSVNPLPATEGTGNPVSLKPGEPVPDPSSMTGNTVASTVRDDEELKAADKAAGEQTFSVNPLPATAGTGNPVKLAPGEPVPHSSTMTDNTVQSTVKLDEASYNAPDAAVAPPVAKEADVNPQETGVFGIPPVTTGTTTIPESSLPIGSDAPALKDEGPAAGIMMGTVGPGATTAAWAGQIPQEPRGVPEVVTESQQAAHTAPEAAANPVAVEEKKELEEELKAKVPEEPPAAESGLPTGKIAAAVGGAVAGAGAVAAATSQKAQDVFANAQKIASGSTSEPAAPAGDAVPEVVKESISEAHASPEAAANPEAVKEKEAMEAELESKVKPTDEAGEPAPTVTAATTAQAPEPTESSSGLNAGAAAPATTPATKENVKPETTDVAAAATNGETPATTTGVATESTPAKSEAGPATPSKATTGNTTATPASATSGTTTGTPGSKTDKKKKRRSVFMEKIKKIFD